MRMSGGAHPQNAVSRKLAPRAWRVYWARHDPSGDVAVRAAATVSGIGAEAEAESYSFSWCAGPFMPFG